MLLQFPREPLAFRDLRRDALAEFRWRCRVPVMRTFGPEAADLGLFVTACDACGGRTARPAPLGDLDPDTTLDGLIAELRTRAGRTRYGWRPAACPACDAPDPTPISALFARHLPEIGHDLHIELVFGGGRVIAVELYRVGPDGSETAIPRPAGELEAQAALGAPLSLRALWRAFLTENVYAPELAVRAVEPGYVIALRPFTDDPAHAEAMLAPFGPFIEGLRRGVEGASRWDAVTFLSERETDGVEVPFAESYHAWLGGYAAEIREGLVAPFIIADSDAFLARLAEHAARYGLRVTREPADDALIARFRGGPLDLRLDLAPHFFRTLHAGLTFERGVLAHCLRPLRAMAEAARLPAIVAELLPAHRVRIVRGQYLELLDPAGRRAAFGDLVRLATHYDLDDPRGRAELCAELLRRDPAAIPAAG